MTPTIHRTDWKDKRRDMRMTPPVDTAWVREFLEKERRERRVRRLWMAVPVISLIAAGVIAWMVRG